MRCFISFCSSVQHNSTFARCDRCDRCGSAHSHLLLPKSLFPSWEVVLPVWIEQKPRYWQLNLVTKAPKYKFGISTWMNVLVLGYIPSSSAASSALHNFFLPPITCHVSFQLRAYVTVLDADWLFIQSVSTPGSGVIVETEECFGFLCPAVGFSCRRYFEWTVEWAHFVCRYEVKTFSLEPDS